MMTSNEAKDQLCTYVSHQSSQYMGSVWESVHHWNADFIAVKWNGEISEFEIKVSKSDLVGEIKAVRRALEKDSVRIDQLRFGGGQRAIVETTKLSASKVEKHHHYLVSQRPLFRPNLFYFAVPLELVEIAKELTVGTKYGVFSIDQRLIVKKATKLHREPHSNSTILQLFSRACTIRYTRLTTEAGEK